MKASAGSVALLVLVVIALMTGTRVTSAQSPNVHVADGSLDELATFVSPAARSVGFTDWGRIRASQGAEAITGASPMDDKIQVVLSTTKDEAAASGFGIAHLREHHDSWAFDALDLDWEAAIQGAGSPLFVLRFRDGFDLAPVAALFDARGFTSTHVPGGTLRSHEMTLDQDWLTTTEFGILNTAFLDDGRTLVLSLDQDQVLDVAARHGSYPDVPGLAATGGVLDGASAALLLPGLDTCHGFSQPSPTGLHPYSVLGIGYGRPDWSPIGRISFGYADPATAQADMADRLALAQTGTSQRVGTPYSEVLFEVEGSRLDGANLTLEVAPHEGMPRRLFDMAFAQDMTFAGC